MRIRVLYNLNSLITTLMFTCVIFVPFLAGLVGPSQLVSKNEKRSLVQIPARPRTLDEVRAFPVAFDQYYSDQFGFREWFTGTHSLTKYLLGDSPSRDVTIGKNGWLFLGSVKNERNRGVMNDVRNINLYTQQELSQFATYIAGLNAWLNERNVKYLFVIAPNKHSIYFNQLPDYIEKVNDQSATDQLIDYLKSHTRVPVVDLRKIFIEEKERTQLYFKSDSHWNHSGANIAQFEIMKEVEILFPGKIEPELFALREAESGGGDLQRLMGIEIFTERNPQPVFEQTCTPKKSPPIARVNEPHTSTCKGQKLKALIYRDSFFNSLVHYFSRKFVRSKYVSGIAKYSSLEKLLETNLPDIVIEEWVERNLPYLPKHNRHFTEALVKNRFEKSQKVIFELSGSKLRFNKWLRPIDHDNKSLRFRVTGKDPSIVFPSLPLKPNREYVLHVNIESSVNSVSQVFYSDADQVGQPFSESNSLRVRVKKGKNNLFIHLNYSNLGNRLRLDPISKPGEMTINSLEIKEIDLLY